MNPPPLKSFWGLVADKSDCPGRMGDPKINKKVVCYDSVLRFI